MLGLAPMPLKGDIDGVMPLTNRTVNNVVANIRNGLIVMGYYGISYKIETSNQHLNIDRLFVTASIDIRAKSITNVALIAIDWFKYFFSISSIVSKHSNLLTSLSRYDKKMLSSGFHLRSSSSVCPNLTAE